MALWVRYLIAVIALGGIVMLVLQADIPPRWKSAIQIVAGVIALILAILAIASFVGI